jgi:hypothetical protein
MPAISPRVATHAEKRVQSSEFREYFSLWSCDAEKEMIWVSHHMVWSGGVSFRCVKILCCCCCVGTISSVIQHQVEESIHC